MLLVKRQPAPAIMLHRGRRRTGPGPSAEVYDLDIRREQNSAAARPDRGTEIDVFGVHEEPLVEAADGVGIRSSNEEAGAADPVRILPAARQGLDRTASRTPLLSPLVERSDHPS